MADKPKKEAMKKVFKLTLEDKGQHYPLWFRVSGNEIVETGQGGGWLWNGRELTTSQFKVGDELTFLEDGFTLRCRVIKVEEDEAQSRFKSKDMEAND